MKNDRAYALASARWPIEQHALGRIHGETREDVAVQHWEKNHLLERANI